MSLQAIRDQALYNYGYYSGRGVSPTDYLSQTYTSVLSKLTSFATLPLPFLSFLAIPFFGSFSTTINLLFFSLTWAALVASHGYFHVEVLGTLTVRILFFLLPSFAVLGGDTLLPSLFTSIKARGEAQLPARIGSRRLRNVAVVSIFNVVLAVALQAAIEFVTTEILNMRSFIRVDMKPPNPTTMIKDLLYGIFCRGFLHYFIHRDLLHASPRSSVLSRWHAGWAHSLRYPFSLAAAYDHPVCYLLAHWLPMYLPATIFRFHALTWFSFLAISSLEQFFIYSGYAVLPSQILLAGMARRTDAHYASKGQGNFGHWGVLDWAFGTSCPGGSDIVDDVREEAEDKDAKGHVSTAVQGAGEKVKGSTDKVSQRLRRRK